MNALVKLFEAPQDVKGATQDAAMDADLYAIDIEETGYQSQFSQLATTSSSKIDPTAQIQDPKQFLLEGIVRFNQAYPGRVRSFMIVMIFPDFVYLLWLKRCPYKFLLLIYLLLLSL